MAAVGGAMVTVPQRNRVHTALPRGSGAAMAAPHGPRMVGPGMEPPRQVAGTTWGQRAKLDQRCRELRDLVTLQEQGMRIFSQSCEEELRLNREQLRSVQQALQEDTRVLDFVLKYNRLPSSDAIAEGQVIAAATENLEEAQKRLEAAVNLQVKVCDALLHQVKQWSQARDEHQKFLQQLQEAEMDDRIQQPQLQVIHQLGNDIEKMLMKIHIAQRVTKLYLQVQDTLKNELFCAPQYLNLMCGMTVMYNEELTARQNLKAADVIRKLMAEARPQLLMERTLRIQSLAEQRAHVKSLEQEIEIERQLREEIVFTLPAVQTQSSSEVLVGAAVKATVTKMEQETIMNNKIEKAKDALNCSRVWDIPGSLLEQQKTLEDLEQRIQESKKQKQVLKQMLKELELKQTKLKFQESLDTTRLQEELRVNLQQEEARLEQMRDQMMKNQEQLTEFENSIDNLFIRLHGITMPGQEPPGKAIGMEEKLQQCEEKLQYLKQRALDCPAEAQTYDKSSKTFEKVRNLLEKTTEGEKQNLKISFEDADSEVLDLLDLEDDDQDYIPSWEDIKKQGLQLVKANTKRKRK